MLMKKFFLKLGPDNSMHGAQKAPEDIAYILEHENFKPITIKGNKKISKAIFLFYLAIFLKFSSKNRNMLIVSQSYGIAHSTLVLKFILRRSIFINLIHDVNYLQHSSKLSKDKEIKFLNSFDYIICHNSKMKEELIKSGVKTKIKILELFDYIIDPNKILENNKFTKKVIVFAGNLDYKKVGFIYQLDKIRDENIVFNFYGPNFDEKLNSNITAHYKGTFNPDDLPFEIRGNYGLIWSGNSLQTCNGDDGAYMRFNNPHKLSLYIAANLPVIVWSQAAIADFVEKNQIGITIDNLYNLSGTLSVISDKDYEVMKKNVQNLRMKIINGYFTRRVINEIISELEGK